jgi:Lipid A 3-O-deacylase (PagL)
MRESFIRPIFIFFIVLSNSSATKAQAPAPDFFQTLSVAVRGYYGFIDPNLPDLQYVIDSRPFLAELSISSQTTGKQYWQQSNGYPELGLSFLFGNSGSRQYIGNVYALVPYIQFSFFNASRINGSFRVGMGGAWVDKTFDPQSDYQNLIIGSHLNFCASLMASMGVRVLPGTYIDFGVSLTHISNGSAKLPNYGLNPVALSVGLKYDLHPPLNMIRNTLPPVDKKWGYYVYLFAAIKEAPPLESAVYLVNVLNLEAMKNFSHTGRFGGGISLTYDRSLTTEDNNSPQFTWDGSKLKLEAALYGAYEYVAGIISFPVHLGFYVYNNYMISSVYEEVGVRFRISDHFIFGGAVKAYLGHGDFIQWGLGYKF